MRWGHDEEQLGEVQNQESSYDLKTSIGIVLFGRDLRKILITKYFKLHLQARGPESIGYHIGLSSQ